MPIVVADRVGNRDVRRVRRPEQRNEPRAMLIGNRDRSGASDNKRNALLDHLLHHFIDSPQVGTPKSRKRSRKHLIQIRAAGDRLSSHFPAHKSFILSTFAHINNLISIEFQHPASSNASARKQPHLNDTFAIDRSSMHLSIRADLPGAHLACPNPGLRESA